MKRKGKPNKPTHNKYPTLRASGRKTSKFGYSESGRMTKHLKKIQSINDDLKEIEEIINIESPLTFSQFENLLKTFKTNKPL